MSVCECMCAWCAPVQCVCVMCVHVCDACVCVYGQTDRQRIESTYRRRFGQSPVNNNSSFYSTGPFGRDNRGGLICSQSTGRPWHPAINHVEVVQMSLHSLQPGNLAGSLPPGEPRVPVVRGCHLAFVHHNRFWTPQNREQRKTESDPSPVLKQDDLV